jgi:hypothetical protein
MHRNRLNVKNQRKLFYTEVDEREQYRTEKNERICKNQRTTDEVNMILRDKDVVESHSSLQ